MKTNQPQTRIVCKIGGLLLAAAMLGLAGCSKSDDGGAAAPSSKFEWTTEISETTPLFVVPGQETVLTYAGENLASVSVGTLPEGWSATVDESARRITLTATESASTKATLEVTATGADAKSTTQQVGLRCLNDFDDPAGVFVLNEGNMTTENGSLTWISPEGYVLADAYKTVNGTELGNVAQDMAFHDGKIYVISQNGDENANGVMFENDGMLVVMDARTLKRTAAYTNDDLEGLNWPSHIAVLDEQHIYLRDNAGIHRFDATTRTLTSIEGSEGAPKSRFVTLGDKVYTYKSSSVFCYLYELSTAGDAVTKLRLPSYFMEVVGIQGADDGRIWVMSYESNKAYINKFDLSTSAIVRRQIGFKPETGSSGVAFVARGNDLYYADGVGLYHLPFDESADLEIGSGLDAEEKLVDLEGLDEKVGILYNGLGIHPVTGRLYANTIRSYALFTQNRIWCLDPTASPVVPVAQYDNYTHFPAGFYFAPAGSEE